MYHGNQRDRSYFYKWWSNIQEPNKITALRHVVQIESSFRPYDGYLAIKYQVYNYLQLLCREIIEFLIERGFPRPIWPAKDHERGMGDLLQAKFVKRTRGEVKNLISRKSRCTQFYRLLDYQVNDAWLKIRNFIMKNPRNI